MPRHSLVLAPLLLAACAGTPRAPAPAPTDEIATGYGSEPRGTSSGAVSTLSQRDVAQQHVASIQELLSRVPGVDVRSRGNGVFSVRVRGIRTINGDNEPLFVVDGVPRPAQSLEAIRPENVRRIDVLKDASSLAMYGARGANGVIVITTLNGR